MKNTILTTFSYSYLVPVQDIELQKLQQILLI